MKLIVGTRGSKLSLAQTDSIIKQLTQKIPEIKIDIKIIKTLGDKLPQKPIHEIKEMGIFEKEIDKAVAEGVVDFAVHSMKDVPVFQPFKTRISSVPKRETPNDVLISKNGLKLKGLPTNAKVGTGSIRRKAQVNFFRPDLNIQPIRGNIDTRIAKLEQGEFDAIILAEAGLKRLNMEKIISEKLSIEDFTPAPGQGALALITREEDKQVIKILKKINHEPSFLSQLAERAFVKEIGRGCKIPLGALAYLEENKFSIIACALSPDGKIKIQTLNKGNPAFPEDLGKIAAEAVLNKGKEKLFKKWSDVFNDW